MPLHPTTTTARSPPLPRPAAPVAPLPHHHPPLQCPPGSYTPLLLCQQQLMVILSKDSDPNADGVRDASGTLLWEPGPNRVADFPTRDDKEPVKAFMVSW